MKETKLTINMGEQRTTFAYCLAPPMVRWPFAADELRRNVTIFFQRRCSSHAPIIKAETLYSFAYFAQVQKICYLRESKAEKVISGIWSR